MFPGQGAFLKVISLLVSDLQGCFQSLLFLLQFLILPFHQFHVFDHFLVYFFYERAQIIKVILQVEFFEVVFLFES